MKLSRRLIPDVTTLQAFECAARHGSFTQAAHELNLTQSAVSRQIKDLEDQLGILLFERIRQRVVLSDNGRRFLPEVRRLLALAEGAMLRTMAGATSEHRLRIGTLPTFGSRWLAPRLPNFLSHHPDTIVDIEVHNAVFDLNEDGIDVAIHFGQPVWARAICSYLCSENIYPVARPDLIASWSLDDPERLVDAPLLQLTTRPKLWADWFELRGGSAETAYRGHRFDQFSMIIEAACAGMGATLLPRYLIEQELATERLALIDETPMQTDNAYYLVSPEGKTDNAVCRAFQEWIRTQVSDYSN